MKIQLIDYKKYQSMAIEQQTRDTVITPKRGVIYDRNMKEIAVSATAETVFISPAEMETEEDARTVAKILSETLELEYDDVLKKTENKKSYYQVIKKKIDIEAATKLREQIKEHGVKGIHLAEDTKRYYPYGSFASQVIGFCGDDNTGLFGVVTYPIAEIMQTGSITIQDAIPITDICQRLLESCKASLPSLIGNAKSQYRFYKGGTIQSIGANYQPLFFITVQSACHIRHSQHLLGEMQRATTVLGQCSGFLQPFFDFDAVLLIGIYCSNAT